MFRKGKPSRKYKSYQINKKKKAYATKETGFFRKTKKISSKRINRAKTKLTFSSLYNKQRPKAVKEYSYHLSRQARDSLYTLKPSAKKKDLRPIRFHYETKKPIKEKETYHFRYHAPKRAKAEKASEYRFKYFPDKQAKQEKREIYQFKYHPPKTVKNKEKISEYRFRYRPEKVKEVKKTPEYHFKYKSEKKKGKTANNLYIFKYHPKKPKKYKKEKRSEFHYKYESQKRGKLSFIIVFYLSIIFISLVGAAISFYYKSYISLVLFMFLFIIAIYESFISKNGE